MLQVRPHGSFRNGFDLLDGSGVRVGAFAGSVWKEGGRIRVGDQEWEFRKQGGRRFVLAGPAGELAAADRGSLFGSSWQLSAGGRAYELVKPSWLSRRYELQAAGRPVGRLGPRGVFDNKADVTLPPELPPAAQVFVVAVVLTLWRRQSAASTAGAGAAAAGAAG